MKSSTVLSTLLAANLALTSPAPSLTFSTSSASTLVPYPAPTGTSSVTALDSSANAAQASAIRALLAQSPEAPNAPNGTLMEIWVTSDMQMYIRYQHAHPHYRDFNTTNGKAPPATGFGDGDDMGYAKLMEAIYGGQKGSLGESMSKAWMLYKSYYGSLPTGVPSAVLSETAGALSTSITAMPTRT